MYARLKSIAQCFFAEFLGSAFILFISCMGGLETRHYNNSLFQYSINVALIVTVVYHSFGHISGGHFGMPVTLAGWIIGVIKFHMIIVYWLAQLLGTILGYGLLKWIMDTDRGFCMTLPGEGVSVGQAFAIEFIMTSIVVIVNCASWDERNAKYQDSMSLRMGITAGTLLFASGNLSGGSMNPARSFSPALWSLYFQDQWIYWVAPLSSSLLTSVVYRFAFKESTRSMDLVK